MNSEGSVSEATDLEEQAPESVEATPEPEASTEPDDTTSPEPPQDDTRTTFSHLELKPQLLQATEKAGFAHPTPIQRRTIPILLEGYDVLACAETGSGKTAAFVLPTLDRLLDDPPGKPRALILSPTRELATQIDNQVKLFSDFTPIRNIVLYGGVGYEPQINAIRRGVDVITATPGRLLDLLSRGQVDLSAIEVFILDEADRMLDMGFIDDVMRIAAALDTQRQSGLFSATMPDPIRKLSERILFDPKFVDLANATPPSQINQYLVDVDVKAKRRVLHEILHRFPSEPVIVFGRTKRGVENLSQFLYKRGYRADAIHGDRSQRLRNRTIDHFRTGRIQILVATDVAARGLDILNVGLVVNYDVPVIAEDYVHRIGRTGRAGRAGMAFTLVSEDEYEYIQDIERITGERLPVVEVDV